MIAGSLMLPHSCPSNKSGSYDRICHYGLCGSSGWFSVWLEIQGSALVYVFGLREANLDRSQLLRIRV